MARTVLEDFGAQVHLGRNAEDLTLRELGEILRIPYSALSLIERGVQVPSPQQERLLRRRYSIM